MSVRAKSAFQIMLVTFVEDHDRFTEINGHMQLHTSFLEMSGQFK